MSEIDYTPNSHKYKAEQAAASEKPKAEKVVTGAVVTKKKNAAVKFADVFISKDIHGLGSYILDDFVIPTTKKLLSDVLKYAVDTIFYGKSGASKARTSGDYVSYNNYSNKRDDRRDEPRRSVFDYDNFTYASRGDAEMVLERMRDMIDRYGAVSVNDLYDMVDKTAPFTAARYGWTSLRGAEITRGRDGYNIELPRAIPLG